jgi:hypothetical protein
MRQQAMRIIKEKKKTWIPPPPPKCQAFLILEGIAYWFCFTRAEMGMDKIKNDSKIKREPNLDRHATVWDLYQMYATFLTPLVLITDYL